MKNFFENWFNTNKVGLYVREQEIDFFNASSKEVYGDFAVQIGLNVNNFLKTINVREYIILGQDIICENSFLPFKSNVLSGFFVLHELDFCANPRLLLKEIHRALAPGGKLILTALNPASILLYLRISNSRFIPKRKDMIHYTRLKEWLELLGFKIILGKFMVYIPINISEKYLNKLKFLENIGNRWWSHCACTYGLVAVKNNYLLDLLSEENIERNQVLVIDQVLSPVKINFNKNING